MLSTASLREVLLANRSSLQGFSEFNVSTGLLTFICLTAGVNLLTLSGHHQIREVITTGIDCVGAECGKERGDGPYIRRGAD